METIISHTFVTERILHAAHRGGTIMCMVSVTSHTVGNSLVALEGVLVTK